MPSIGNKAHIVPEKTFTAAIWTLCGVALLFLASRFAVRISTKGKLMINDYFLVAAVPFLLTGFSLLQSVFHRLYWIDNTVVNRDHTTLFQSIIATPRLVAAIEFIWVSIYCVKFCYLAQFKFYKPPYAYVDPFLTRYYWTAIGLCSAGFVFTIVQPVILCPKPDKCLYIDGSDTRSWEVVVTAVDIATDLLVISIPTLLIYMVNAVRSYTIANFVFKSLSVFNIVVAATRLALQYNAKYHRIQYTSVLFLLVIEGTVSLIMASIAGYRVLFLDHLMKWERRKAAQPTLLTVRHPAAADQHANNVGSAKPSAQEGSSLSDFPILSDSPLR